MNWQALDELQRDGRQVLFWAPAGAFVAPALTSMTRDALWETQREVYQETGAWPRVEYIPTAWAEIVPPTPKQEA